MKSVGKGPDTKSLSMCLIPQLDYTTLMNIKGVNKLALGELGSERYVF